MTLIKVKMCSCGHEAGFHEEGKGPCRYGHNHVMGGCTCPSFGRRKRAEAIGVELDVAGDASILKALDTAIAGLVGLRSAMARSRSSAPAPVSVAVAPRVAVAKRVAKVVGDGKLSGAERKVLTVLAQHPEGRSKTQIAILAGYSHTSGGFRNTLSALRSTGRLEGNGERMRITDIGRADLGAFEPLPSGRALLSYWEQNAGGKCERMILGELAAVHPRQLTKEALASRTGYQATSGGFRNALSRLRTLQLMKGRGELGLTPELAYAIA